MSVTEKCLNQQIKRLMRLPFAPAERDDIQAVAEEFKRVLKTRVVTDAHCAAVIDHLMAHAQRCPPPAEVIEAAERVEAPDAVKAPMGCQQCHGSGFRSFTRKVKAGVHEYEAEIADFCQCALGEFKRAGEARDKAEREAKSRR